MDSLQRSFVYCCFSVTLCNKWIIVINEAKWPPTWDSYCAIAYKLLTNVNHYLHARFQKIYTFTFVHFMVVPFLPACLHSEVPDEPWIKHHDLHCNFCSFVCHFINADILDCVNRWQSQAWTNFHPLLTQLTVQKCTDKLLCIQKVCQFWKWLYLAGGWKQCIGEKVAP